MRVLHITPSLFCPTSGLATVVNDSAAGLHAAGVDITVASLRDASDECEDVEFQCLLAERSRLPVLAAWHYSRRLRSMIEASFSTPPDIVHAHGLWLYPQRLAASLARQWQRPLVITLHGMLEPWRRRHHGWRKKIMWQVSDRRTIASADALIATSDQEAENLRKLEMKQPVVVIPPGVQVPEWVCQRSEGGGQRTEGRGQRPEIRHPTSDIRRPTSDLGPRTSDADRQVALFLSRIHPSKGLALLVDAVARLRPPGWRFVIAGPDEGGHGAEMRTRIRRLGLEDWFSFVGPVHGDDKWRLYRAANLFVLPSYNENFGLVIAEALAAGLPVVTTTDTPWGELQQRKCGWICEPTVNALALVLSKVFACPDERLQQMGAAGSAWVRQTFTPEENTRRHVDVYEKLLTSEYVSRRGTERVVSGGTV